MMRLKKQRDIAHLQSVQYLPFFYSLMLLGALMGWLAYAQPISAQSGPPLKLEREVVPQGGMVGQTEFTVTLKLIGNPTVCVQTSTISKPADVLLVVDRSGSMYENGGQKMTALKQAARAFVGKIDFRRDLIGLVEFDSAGSVSQELTNNADVIRQAIEGITSGGGTSIDQGVELAMREFETRGRAAANQVMILLTDGQHGGLPFLPQLKALEARSRGIRIITIGLGADADQNLLRNMASQTSDYYFAPTPDKLEAVYSSIANKVSSIMPARDITVEHSVNASAIEVIPDSLLPKGTINGNKITWVVKSVLEAPVELKYRARARSVGNVAVDAGDVVNYTRCEQQPDRLNVTAGLPIQVQGPPTPTPTLTPIPTPTLGPTFTPSVPVKPAATTSTIMEQISSFLPSFLCDLSWVSICSGILLLLFLLWWLWKLINELRKPPEERCVCKLLPWLFLPLTLLFLGQVLSIFTDAVCASRETVYFWRIGREGEAGRIFTTDKDGVRPMREFSAVNQGQCTGCHIVSSSSHQLAAISGGGVGPLEVHKLDGKRVNVPRVIGTFSAWSPDGSKLAVATSDLDIVVVDLKQQTTTKLNGASDPNFIESMPAWSPDGQSIAFVRAKSVSPLGAFAFTGATDIFVVPATGGTAVAFPGASGIGFNYYPAYSPDGRWLAFTRHVNGTSTYADDDAEIYVLPATGGTATRLKANDAADGSRLSKVSNSWSTWSLDGKQIAFTSKRSDPRYDIFVANIGADGNSGAATPLKNAAVAGAFEHLPFWGRPPEVDMGEALLGLWPWLIPFLLLALLNWLCRRLIPCGVQDEPVVVPYKPDPKPLPPIKLEATWQVAPTLILGVGGTGRWVLTHLKKALRDGGAGTMPDKVRFLLLDTAEQEEMNVFHGEDGKQQTVGFADVQLEPHEVLLINQNLALLIQRTRDQAEVDTGIGEWFPDDDYRNLPTDQWNLASGTNGRRPMARAGLIDKLRNVRVVSQPNAHQLAGDAATLWQALLKGCNDTREEKINRVILVGSMSGGMSGTIFDLAYLARKAATQTLPAGGTVHVEGHFASQGAFDELNRSNTGPRLQVNTYATARELQRFQLSQGFAFPMRYGEAEQTPLDGASSDMMFDNLTLYGGDGVPQHEPGKEYKPWATVFASMADVLALRLDRATNAGGQGDYHASLKADMANKQANSQMAVASTAGSFVYRLPLLDIIEIAQARWARKLLSAFMNELPGPSPKNDAANVIATDVVTETVTPKQMQHNGLPNIPAEYANNFFKANCGADHPPEGVRAVGALVDGHSISSYVQKLTGSSDAEFQKYLAWALKLILNGRDSDVGRSRYSDRAKYASDFVMALHELLQQAIQQAQGQKDKALTSNAESNSLLNTLQAKLGSGGSLSKTDWQNAIDKMQAWQKIVLKSGVALQTSRSALANVDAVQTVLEVREYRAEQRRKQMDQVAVRRYLWHKPIDPSKDASDPKNQIDIVEVLGKQADAKLKDYLKYFYWREQADGTLRFVLTSDHDVTLTLDSHNETQVEHMADEITHLATHVIKECLGELSLQDILPTQLAHEGDDPALRLLEHAWQASQPHLSYASNLNGNLDGVRKAVVGMPQGLQNSPQETPAGDIVKVFKAMRELRSNRLNQNLDPCPADLVSSTDRNSLILLREYHLMPIANLPEIELAWQAYCRNAVARGPDQLAEPSWRTAVFVAERTALEFERRLESTNPQVTNIDFHALHPLLVLALAQPERTDLYSAAFAAGWVQHDGSDVRVAVPNVGNFSLPLRGGANAGRDWRVAGLLQFVSDEVAHQPLQTALHTAFSGVAAPREAWRQFIARYRATGPRPFSTEQERADGVYDFGAMAALMAYWWLVAPESRVAKWRDLLMTRPRNC